MQYTATYPSPLGEILLASDDEGLTGLWFDQQKYYAQKLAPEHVQKETPAIQQTLKWLDLYFAGREPGFLPPLHLIGTPFQKDVWRILLQIPYGKTTTYGEIAQKIAAQRGLAHMSAHAVGGAISHNEISLIIPCHRVVGKSGSLTGYAGGIDRKIYLLKLEGGYKETYFVPKHSTAP